MALTGVNEEGLPTKDVFDKLGLSLDELSDMSPINALQAIGEKINGLASAAEKTRALKDLFGRSGPTLGAALCLSAGGGWRFVARPGARSAGGHADG